MRSIWLSMLLVVSSTSHAANAELDQVLEQVKSGSLQDQQLSNEHVSNKSYELKEAQANFEKAQRQLDKTQKANAALEEKILQLQQSLQSKRAQYQSQRQSLDTVFKHIVEHGGLMLERVLPHGLWVFDQSQFVALDESNVDIAHIKKLWVAMVEQTILSGKAISSNQQIILSDGQPNSTNVTQFGPFNAKAALAKDSWLTYLPAQGSWMVMSPQPIISQQKNEMIVDPSFGALLEQNAQSPTLLEKLAPTGIVGILIAIVGIIGFGIAVVRSFALRQEKRRIYAQMKETTVSQDNALGRVISATLDRCNAQLEAVIDEAVLKEVPSFKSGVGSLAVFASIPPLLGLLGTVGGMIETFRIITEHGSADSQLLSGGISQALLTTELGLMVAVPLLLLHCGLKAQSTQLIEILEQQSAGLIVLRQKSEKLGA
ncbi:MotA/TolQ/ExbB proton channel family protein [Vibrio gigantis]|uniref:MotA/TolQ/ExbB proton channel family protein n=1 Tax=Vibrio gigantis TaxID=296199 RepID=UPI002FCA19F5